MSAAAEKQIAEIHKLLTNGGSSLVGYPNQDKQGSMRYGVQRAWYWAWLAAGKVIAPNSWMAKRWPDIPKDGYSPRTYWRAAYGHARKAGEQTDTIIEGQVKQAARLAAVEDLLHQVLDTPGQPINMEQVAAAAEAGAQQALATLDVRIEITPAEEPTGAEDGDASNEP